MPVPIFIFRIAGNEHAVIVVVAVISKQGAFVHAVGVSLYRGGKMDNHIINALAVCRGFSKRHCSGGKVYGVVRRRCFQRAAHEHLCYSGDVLRIEIVGLIVTVGMERVYTPVGQHIDRFQVCAAARGVCAYGGSRYKANILYVLHRVCAVVLRYHAVFQSVEHIQLAAMGKGRAALVVHAGKYKRDGVIIVPFIEFILSVDYPCGGAAFEYAVIYAVDPLVCHGQQRPPAGAFFRESREVGYQVFGIRGTEVRYLCGVGREIDASEFVVCALVGFRRRYFFRGYRLRHE